MATSSEAQTLVTEARCYACFAGMEWYVVLAALIDVRDGNPVPTDTNELLAEATCLQCIPAGMVPAVMVNLLRGISSGGGGAQQVYIDRDPLPPNNPALPALNFPSGGGVLTQFDVDSQTWI